MSQMMPCHNPKTCPTRGTSAQHIPGSQIESICRKQSKRKAKQVDIPTTPPGPTDLSGFARSPADADPYFVDSETWRDDGGETISGYDYNPETGLLAISFRPDNGETLALVYRNVSAEVVQDIDESDESIDEQFSMKVMDEFEVYALGEDPRAKTKTVSPAT